MMKAAKKYDIKEILKKGRLTGIEAGRLIIEDNFEVDHNRPGFLRKQDAEAIRNSLRTPDDIEDFNGMLRLYERIDYTIRDAKIAGLEAERYLSWLIRLMDWVTLESRLLLVSMFQPAIVTQKQYDELQLLQREDKLLGVENILARIWNYILENFEHDAGTDSIEDDEDSLADIIRENRPPEITKALLGHIDRLKELIRAGKLRPGVLLPGDAKRLARLKLTKKGASPEQEEEAYRRSKIFHLEALERGIQATRPEDVIALLEKLQAGSAEAEEALEDVELAISELYEAGLEDVVEYVDNYIIGFDSATAAGKSNSTSTAIIQHPSKASLDERGWYKGRHLFEEIETLRPALAIKAIKKPEFIEWLYHATIERLKGFILVEAMLRTVSKCLGLKLDEDLEQERDILKSNLDIFNLALLSLEKELAGWPFGIPRPECLQPIKLGELKPRKRDLDYYQERLTIGISKGWSVLWTKMSEDFSELYEAGEDKSFQELIEQTGDITDELKELASKSPSLAEQAIKELTDTMKKYPGLEPDEIRERLQARFQARGRR